MSPRRPSRFVALVGMVTLLHGSGCSWIFIQKPPPGPVEPVPPVECTSSNELPVVDSIVGWPLVAAGTVGALYGFLPTAFAGDAPWPIFWGGLAAAVAGSIVAGSGLSGFKTTMACRDLQERQLECVSGVEAACLTLKERKP
jgi:hypothetical protein